MENGKTERDRRGGEEGVGVERQREREIKHAEAMYRMFHRPEESRMNIASV
jgi:hypothetical protein